MSSTLPTPDELREFARLFSRYEWAILCSSDAFVQTLINDGPAAVAGLSLKILRNRPKLVNPPSPR